MFDWQVEAKVEREGEGWLPPYPSPRGEEKIISDDTCSNLKKVQILRNKKKIACYRSSISCFEAVQSILCRNQGLTIKHRVHYYYVSSKSQPVHAILVISTGLMYTCICSNFWPTSSSDKKKYTQQIHHQMQQYRRRRHAYVSLQFKIIHILSLDSPNTNRTPR